MQQTMNIQKNCGACRFVFKGVAKISKTGWKTHESFRYFDIIRHFWFNLWKSCVSRNSSLNTKAFFVYNPFCRGWSCNIILELCLPSDTSSVNHKKWEQSENFEGKRTFSFGTKYAFTTKNDKCWFLQKTLNVRNKVIIV